MSWRKLIMDGRADEDKKCAICREELNDGPFIITCRHTFHRTCLIQWMKIHYIMVCSLYRNPLPKIPKPKEKKPLPVCPKRTPDKIVVPLPDWKNLNPTLAIPWFAIPALPEDFGFPPVLYLNRYKPSGQRNISRML